MDEDNLPVTFGEWMKHRRRTLDLTQAELAQRSGCSIFTLRKIESGERRPSKQLARLFARSLEFLGEAQAAAGSTAEARQTFLDAIRLAFEAEGDPLVLDALLGLAHLQAGAGDSRGSMELARCVLSHPAGTHEAKDRASRLIAELQRQPDHQLEGTLGAEGRTKPLEEIVKCLLVQSRDESPPGTHPPSR